MRTLIPALLCASIGCGGSGLDPQGVTVRIIDLEPECPADIDGNDSVDVLDLIALITAWGTDDPAADITDDGTVDVNDLVALIVAWGAC